MDPFSFEVYPRYSQITLQLRPAALFHLPSPTAPPFLHPVQTFRRAFVVFLSIFGFLLDILIWIVVVAGPFLLIALGMGAVIRKRRRVKASSPKSEDHASL
jgi:hypothetical protein